MPFKSRDKEGCNKIAVATKAIPIKMTIPPISFAIVCTDLKLNAINANIPIDDTRTD